MKEKKKRKASEDIFIDVLIKDMEIVGVKAEETGDMVRWRQMISCCRS